MQTLSSDTNLCLQLSGTTTLPAHCSNEPMKAGSPDCTCTTETCSCSIHPAGRDEWIASMQDSLAQIFHSPVMGQALKASTVDCGKKSNVSLTTYDQASCSWRTHQQSLLGDLEPFLETWPTWGMTQNGVCSPLQPLVPRTYELDGGALRGVPTPTRASADKEVVNSQKGRNIVAYAKGVWPTPTAANATQGPNIPKGTRGPTLVSAIKMFPTPVKSDYKSGKFSEEGKAKRDSHSRGKPLNETIGGQLNPVWVEWLMGWPIGATELKPSATDKCHSKPLRPIDS